MELGAVLSLRDRMSANMEKAGRSVNEMTDRVEKQHKALSKLGSVAKTIGKVVAVGIAAATVAVVGFGISAVNTYMEYDNALRNVAATLGTDLNTAQGQADFVALSAGAQEMGRTTQYSAIEATGGLDALAAAGYDTQDAITALPSVLKLAAAGGLDVATAATYATQTMSALQEPVENMEVLFNQWAKAGAVTNAGVQELGEGFLTLGSTAKNAGLDIADTNTALGILANNGMLGSEGGTALRNVLLSLTAPTDVANKALKNLGVSVADADGSIRPFNDILVDLNAAMGDMSEAEKLKSMSEIFNKNDLKAVSALMNSAGEEFSNIKSVIENSEGAMEQMAETMTGGLGGSIKQMQNSIEGLKISFGENLAPAVGEGVNLITGYVNKLSDSMSGGVDGVMGAMNEIVGDIVVQLSSALPKVLSFGADLIVTLVRGIAQNLPAVTTAALDVVLMLLNTLLTMVPMLVDAGFEMLTGLVQGIADALPQIIPAAIRAITEFVDSIITNAPLLLEAGINMIMGLVDGLLAALPDLISQISVLFQKFVDACIEATPMIINAGMELLQGLINGIIQNLPLLVKAALSMINALVNGLAQNIPVIINAALQLINALITGLIQNLPLIVQAALSLVMSLLEGIVQNLSLIINGAMQLVNSLISGLILMLPSLVQAALQLVIGLVTGILENLPMIIAAGIQLVVSLALGLTQAIPQLVAAVPMILIAIIETILNTNWLEVGVQIAVGIIKGLLSMVTGIFDAVSQLVSGVIGFFKKLLGIGGDEGAAATNEIGQATGQGFKAGMESSTADVQAASENLASTAADSLLPDPAAITGMGSEVSSQYAAGITGKSGEAVTAASLLASNVESAGTPNVSVNFNDVDTTALQAAMPVIEQFQATGAAAFQAITAEIQTFISTVQGIDLFTDGQNIISGFIGGLESMEGELIATAKRIANSVSSTVESALDIHSPSRVMEGLGENSTEGMINGVEKPRAKLELASRQLGGSVASGTATGMQYDYSDLAAAQPTQGTYNYDQSNTTNNNGGGRKQVVISIEKIIDRVEVRDEGDEDRLAEKIFDRLADLIEEADDNMGEEDVAV